jgi:hypothetical protein
VVWAKNFVAVGGRILLMRSPHRLIFMRMTNDIATCMYHTGIDPFTGQEVIVSKRGLVSDDQCLEQRRDEPHR